MWTFSAPEDEPHVPESASLSVQFRPTRMALGCSAEMIQEKISSNAKKVRLQRLLKRQGGIEDDGLHVSRGTGEEELSRAHIKAKTATVSEPKFEEALTKSQKKRQKAKLKDLQRKLLHPS